MDNFIIVNRTINKPLELADVAVAGDSNSKKITFKIERYFDKVDLSSKQVKINFINAQKKSGSTDSFIDRIEDESFTFSWLLASETVVADGKVEFGVEFFEVDTAEQKIYVWQTKPSFFNVEKTIITIGDAVATDYIRQISFYNNNNNDRIYQAMQDSNPIIEIDDRNILLGVLDDIVVSQDNLSQILSFKISRYFDGIDLSSKKICINFINAKGESDQTSPVNVKVKQLELEFGWLLDSKVAAKDGNVLFSVAFIGFHENGEFYYRQTKPATFKVEKGLFIDDEIETPQPSWLQALNLELVHLNEKVEAVSGLENIDLNEIAEMTEVINEIRTLTEELKTQLKWNNF